MVDTHDVRHTMDIRWHKLLTGELKSVMFIIHKSCIMIIIIIHDLGSAVFPENTYFTTFQYGNSECVKFSDME